MRAQGTDLQRRDRVRQIIDGAGRTREVENVIHGTGDLDRLAHVVLEEPEPRLVRQVGDVAAIPGQEVVDADDLMAIANEAFAKMRANKSGSARYDRSQAESS